MTNDWYCYERARERQDGYRMEAARERRARFSLGKIRQHPASRRLLASLGKTLSRLSDLLRPAHERVSPFPR